VTDLSNSNITLTSYCDRWENLDNDREALKVQRTEAWAELKAKNLPIAAMKSLMAQGRKDAEKLALARDDMKNAGELMGVTVFVGEITAPTDDPYAKDTVTFAKQRIAAIETFEADIKAVGEDIKVLLAEVKSTGFTPSLIPTIVAIRKDPAAYYESNVLLNTYLTALGVSNNAS
jgi:uncharacterized protein (UPF0335 family)